MLSTAPPLSAAASPPARPYVLLVDDHIPSLCQLREIVATAGHACRTAGSATEALRQCDLARPRLVVTDLAMPNLDGRGLARWLHERCPSVPLILLTGEMLDRRALAALRPAFAAVMTKPVDVAVLLGLIDRLMPPRDGPEPPCP
jgi:CheY-like chemotaxis protein